MHTVCDWVTLAMFCALVILFLQRSAGPAVPGDRIVNYLPPAIGCAAANQVGNAGHDVAAGVIVAATIAYTLVVLRPQLPTRP